MSRGLMVLKALNSVPGGIASTSELAQACSIHRTTVKRLLETLRRQGFVRSGEREGQYYLTFEVRRLSEGFQDEAWVSQVATPLMHAAVRDLLWPSDLATLEGGFMVVRESTHRWSSLSQHHAMIGEKLPLFVTALGRAYMSACAPDQLDALLVMLGARTDWIGAMARDRTEVDTMIRETRRAGFATNEGEWSREAHFGGMAVPVHGAQALLGAINIVFPKDAVTAKDMNERFAPRLKKLAAAIGKSSQSWQED